MAGGLRVSGQVRSTSMCTPVQRLMYSILKFFLSELTELANVGRFHATWLVIARVLAAAGQRCLPYSRRRPATTVNEFMAAALPATDGNSRRRSVHRFRRSWES